LHSLPEGRTATENSLTMAKHLGCDFICLTGNPKSGVTNEKIEQAITLENNHFGGLIIAGKMHNAGTAGSMFDFNAFSRFAEVGADVILFPAPGTVPGVREETLAQAIENVKNKGACTIHLIS
jgi:hypothetical protein